MSLLSERSWKPKYDTDGGRLLGEFFEPALGCAVRYDRTTGYFSAGVLSLAARGVEGLLRLGGRMRLVVGCTLDPPEADAIVRGEGLRETVSAHLLRNPLTSSSQGESDALELLAWMVANGRLEVRVAVPCDADRRPLATNALFHEKAGVVEDKAGDRLAFNGSVNETVSGWQGNWESFHVFTSWTGDDGRARVEVEEEGFARLWNDRAAHCRVVDVPSALRDDLLRFLPAEGALPVRLRAGNVPPAVDEPSPAAHTAPPRPAIDVRRLVWGVIEHAPGLPGGERVGEATSIVTPWPHQVRAFDRAYRSWPPRLLIADEVGLGKTIEAGLLLRQAWLAGLARRVLIMAPRAVLTQWQVELREKFNLSWPVYDGQRLLWPAQPARPGGLDQKVSRSAWHLQPFVIASSHLLRRADRFQELVEDAEPYDLVVLDEAHHARRKGAGLTKDHRPNRLLALMQALRTRSRGLLLLTATPMQVHPVEVWDLLNLLGLPEGWTEAAFVRFYETVAQPSPSIDDFDWMSSLFRTAEARFGPVGEDDVRRFLPNATGLGVRKVLAALRDGAATERRKLETDRRRAALQVMRSASPVARLISRHTRELLRRYHRLGRITSRIADRDVRDVFIALTPDERRVYEAVERYIATTYDQASAADRNAVGFVMTTYRRRLASSFRALSRTLEARLRAVEQRRPAAIHEEDLPDDDAADEPPDEDEADELGREALRLEEKADLAALLSATRALPRDTKAGRLLDEVAALRGEGYPQVMVFTQYTDTMDFLREQFAKDARLLCFSGRGGERPQADGRWEPVSRDDIKRLFRAKAADVLLCTDAAAEGLNFQFCGALVNYDLPWNPMRVEQRIGRIDRLGQEHAVIRIVNLHYENTVETDVYRALRERIGLFAKFVGRLQPILSALPGRIQEAALRPPDAIERRRLVDQLVADVDVARESGFDLDSVTETDLDEPVRPPALYGLDDLGRVLARPNLLPPGVEARALDRDFECLVPGMRSAVRVTTDPRLFEEHPGSVELWSPGSPVFPQPGEAASAEEVRLMGGRLDQALGET